jgi:ABC-type multidrug transport system ATPase subunit
MNTLKIKNLALNYKNGVRALNNISLEINNGMFGLLGPNGAGKSSLMKTIVGLQKPSSGAISFNEVDIVKQPDYIKKQLGFLPQDFGVYPNVGAYDLLDHIAKLKGVSDARLRKNQIVDLLEKVNLSAFKNIEVHTFSGGMKQRFGVAQALLGHPSIVIVDEPTAGLDPEERNRFNLLLADLSEEIIVILSTHLVEDVRNLCSSMAIMKQGEIIVAGPPTELLKNLEGKIWTKNIDKAELVSHSNMYQVISHHLVSKQLQIYILADESPNGFSPTAATLEHLYFLQLNHGL